MIIVAAVDRSDRAVSVIKEAESLADAFDDTIHVVHSLTSSKFVKMARTAAEDGDSISMDDVRKVAREVADEAVSNAGSSHQTIGLMGDPADRIIDYADEQETRYIVISGRKRSPAGKAIFGSVSQSILLHADCPVVSAIKRVE